MFIEFISQLHTAILSCPIVYIPDSHYAFVDEILKNLLENSRNGLKTKVEDVIEYDASHSMVRKFVGKKQDVEFQANHPDIFEQEVLRSEDRNIILLKDFHRYIARDSRDDKGYVSILQLFAQKYENGDYDKEKSIIIVSPEPVSELHGSLEKLVTVIEIKRPDKEEIASYVSENCRNEFLNDKELKYLRENMTTALQGMSYYEVKQILRSSLAKNNNRLSVSTIVSALEEKKQIVRKSGLIEVVDTDVEFSQIGGLDVLKKDLEEKATIYKNIDKAIEMNLALPKGVLLIGMPGCGKTMIAKAIAKEFGVTLLRLDIGKCMGKYVGESEDNLRKALAVADAAHPCVLWIDEIEKAFAGTNNGDNSDNVTTRLMGYFLTWMQERKTSVYIVATANDVMKPEFMRKGRFDEVYFVDFPTAEERALILKSKIKNYGSLISLSDTDIEELTQDDRMEISNIGYQKNRIGGFSGAEIESLVNSVASKAFCNYLKPDSMGESYKASKRDFITMIENMKESLIANQKSLDENKPTNIEKIRKFCDIYHFKRASEDEKKRK